MAFTYEQFLEAINDIYRRGGGNVPEKRKDGAPKVCDCCKEEVTDYILFWCDDIVLCTDNCQDHTLNENAPEGHQWGPYIEPTSPPPVEPSIEKEIVDA